MNFIINRHDVSSRRNLILFLSLILVVAVLLSPLFSLAAVPLATTQVSKLCEVRAGDYDLDQYDSGQQTYEQATGCNLSVLDGTAEGNAGAGFGPGVPWIGITTVDAQISTYNGIAESDLSASVQYHFEIKPVKVAPGTPPALLPVLFGARGKGYSQRLGYGLSRSIGVVHLYGDPLDYDDARFEFEAYVVDETAYDPIDEEYQERGFDEMRPLDLHPNYAYGVVVSAACGLWAGPVGQDAAASARCSAEVDPVIGFDQARFDEIMDANTFPLNEYYAFVFSENLPVSLKVRVMSPNGGEPLAAASTHRIKWLSPTDAVRFNLSQSQDNGVTWKVIQRSVGGNFYDWTVPKPTKNRTKCLVKAVGFNGSGNRVGTDKSDAPFAIEVIRLTSPNAGEPPLTSGGQHTVTWTTNATKAPVDHIVLSYTLNNGRTWKRIDTTADSADDGSVIWNVPDVTSQKNNCRVKIVLKDISGNTVGSDASDGVFTIQLPPLP
jgi:hypothetical protein